jgi:hypothetical protein
LARAIAYLDLFGPEAKPIRAELCCASPRPPGQQAAYEALLAGGGRDF